MYDDIVKDYLPKYIKISEDIKQDIESGALKYGEKIYSEKDIMNKYNVSSTTARKSLDVLKRENLIESIQGKGSFILQTKILRSLKKVISFSENMKKQSLEPSSKMIEKRIISDFTEYHKKLNLSEGEKILKIKRVKYGNDIPLLIDTRYINIKYCPGIESLDLNDSLYEIYESYKIKIVHSKQILQLSFLDENNAKLLNCKKFDPVIRIEGTLYSEDFSSIEYEEDLWNGAVFSFYVEASL
ncbi:MAG: GntR family transcriptional regulator [Actinomycetota bacterium]|nr:GntR family transcriptional regulator [Actinomycetota bacterium]